MTQTIYLMKSPKPDKKWRVVISETGKTIDFGASGYSDYTKHKDSKRMGRYTTRHKSRESWGKKGITTAGFWSKWLLWNKPTLTASISDIQKRFNVKIIRGKPVLNQKPISRKGSRKVSRKGSRKVSRKGTRKVSRKGTRKGSRKSSRKGTRKN